MSVESPVTAPADPPQPRIRIGPWKLMVIFARITLSGFGGVMPFAYRSLVERRKLIDNTEFGGIYAFATIVPGPPIVNLTLTVGYRDSGTIGALAAVLGLVLPPFGLILLIALFYSRHADLEVMRQAIGGMAAVTAGLVVATALKMSSGLHRQWKGALLFLAAFLSIGVLRLPFLAVICVLAPVAVWLGWKWPDEG